MTKNILLGFIFCFLALNTQAQNKKIIDSLNIVYSTAKHDTTKIMTLIDIANEYHNSKPDTCISLATQALDRSEKIGFEKGKGWSLFQLGIGNNRKNKYPEALNFYQKALFIFEKTNDRKGLGYTWNTIGGIFYNQGNYPLALEYWQKSLKIFEEIGNKRGISNALINIGNIYNNQGNSSLALEYFQKSLKMAEVMDDRWVIGNALGNIGIIYHAQGNYPLALEYQQKTLKIQEDMGNKQGISATLIGIGDIYNKQNNFSLALEFYQKSLQIKEKIGDKWGATFALKGIAEVYQKQKDYDKSIEYAQKSLQNAQEIRALAEIGDASKTLFETYKLKGNYIKALEYHELYKQSNDSLFNVNKSRAFANLEAKAEIEKKQLEILKEKEAKEFQQDINYLVTVGLLSVLVFAYLIFKSRQKERKAKELISLQAKQLMEVNNSKDKLFAILGHDLRSPIATLESFLELMQTGLISTEEFKTHLPTFYSNVKNVQTMLGNLLQWSLSQMNGINAQPTKVDTQQIISENVNFFNTLAATKNITLTANVPENVFVWADENHLRLVLRNLINNAIKFTPKGGQIKVQIDQKQAKIEISITDNGVGMTEKQIAKLFEKNQNFTTSGTSGEKGTGLGLQLCQEIVVKNGGEIWVESVENKGSTFTFSLPINPINK